MANSVCRHRKTAYSAHFMLLRIFGVTIVTLGISSAAIAQTWLQTTPREAHDIPGSTGQWVDFPTVQLATGMEYAIHSTGRTLVQSPKTDYADAHYYDGALRLASGLVQVGIQVKYNLAQSDFLQVRSPAPFSASHDYQDRLASAGTPLSFRFFDTQEYPGSKPYYSDNLDSIHIEVAQATAQLIVKTDTLDFGDVDMRSPRVLQDSVESIGTDPFVVDTVYVSGSPDFHITFAERGVSKFSIQEEQTNGFAIEFAPTVLGRQEAILHVRSRSAFGLDKDRQIVLIGIGHGPIVQAIIDTIHFGTTPPNIAKQKSGKFINIGDRSAAITDVSFNSGTVFWSSDHKSVSPGDTIDVLANFQPPVPGYYLSAARLTLDSGWKDIPFYADGTAASGQATVHPDTLDFGYVTVGSAKSLPAFVTNSGITDFQIVGHNVTNTADFSVAGGAMVTLTSGSTEQYGVTFSPASSTGVIHTGTLTFTFDDGQPPKTIILIGREHLPITGALRIRRNYWAMPDANIVVTQDLLTSVGGALDSVRRFTETISFDPNLLDLNSVSRGKILSTDWNLASASISLGVVQIIANSTGYALTGPGELLQFAFHVHADAPFWDTSEFPQTSIVFGTGVEPLMTAQTGLLRIRNSCTPTFLESGGHSTGIIGHSLGASGGELVYSIGDDVPPGSQFSLRAYNELGIPSAVLADGDAVQGEYSVDMRRSALSAGVYAFVLEVNGTVRDVRRLIITP
jgi:hypothetical protein